MFDGAQQGSSDVLTLLTPLGKDQATRGASTLLSLILPPGFETLL